MEHNFPEHIAAERAEIGAGLGKMVNAMDMCMCKIAEDIANLVDDFDFGLDSQNGLVNDIRRRYGLPTVTSRTYNERAADRKKKQQKETARQCANICLDAARDEERDNSVTPQIGDGSSYNKACRLNAALILDRYGVE